MIKLIFSIFPFLWSSIAFANCPGLALSDLPAEVDFNTNINPRVNFRVTRQDETTECDYKIGFDRGSSPNYNRKLYFNTNTLDFNIGKDAPLNTILKDVIDANNNGEILKGSFKSAKPNKPKKLFNNHKFFTGLTLNPNIPAGTYQDTILVKLYDDDNGNYTLVDTKSILFFYGMPSQVSLSLVNTNAAFDPLDTSQNIDFGSLTQGETQTFDAVIQSTNGYILEISSSNNGKLKHTTMNQFVDYIFRANNQAFNLSGSSSAPVTISSNIGAHPSDGFRIPIQFEIGSTSDKLSGAYSDTLTITVTSNL